MTAVVPAAWDRSWNETSRREMRTGAHPMRGGGRMAGVSIAMSRSGMLALVLFLARLLKKQRRLLPLLRDRTADFQLAGPRQGLSPKV